MESKWDIVFACKTEVINRLIREQKTAFLDSFNFKNGTLIAKIPDFQIAWAGNEQYMALDLTLSDVTICFHGITEKHRTIHSRVHLQFSFKDEENVGFICKTMATHPDDVTFGAIWVENADVEKVIQDEVLQDAFGSLLGKALIEQESNIGFVLANLKKTYFQPLGITIYKSVPAFQNLNGTLVIAIMCMTKQTKEEPSRQFSPSLLLEYDFGYIMRREVFLEKFILPNIQTLLNITSGTFKVFENNSIVNDGNVHISTVSVSGTSYKIMASLLKLQFMGDYLHLLVEGSADFTGLADSYITYSFHAIRQPQFTTENGGKISFVPIPDNPDSYHSDKHIPLWIEITAGIFTFGLFTMISEIFYDEIQSKVKNMMNQIKYNGEEGGYFLTWANKNFQFCDGGFAENFYMRGKNI
ncbi:MAG: TULIP family P47-like protein [Lachnospiraceae bacterium]